MNFSSGPVIENLPAVQETWVQFLAWEDSNMPKGN